MVKRVITHEIKLERSAKIILAVLAIGVLANAFAPAFDVENVLAELGSHDTINVKLSGPSYQPIAITCDGCN